jgi:hypothetical protein
LYLFSLGFSRGVADPRRGTIIGLENEAYLHCEPYIACCCRIAAESIMLEEIVDRETRLIRIATNIEGLEGIGEE